MKFYGGFQGGKMGLLGGKMGLLAIWVFLDE